MDVGTPSTFIRIKAFIQTDDFKELSKNISSYSFTDMGPRSHVKYYDNEYFLMIADPHGRVGI